MTAIPERPWAARSALARFAPPLLVVALLAAVAAVGTAHGRREPTEAIVGPTAAEVRGYARNPDLPITYQEAKEAGTVDQYDWGEHCDTKRAYDDTGTTLARVAMPSTYSPPCVPAWGGSKPWVSQGGRTFTSNGGATAPGVTATSIKVVVYLSAAQDVSTQIAQFGVFDDQQRTFEGIRDLVEMSNGLYETYGRKVEVVPFHATGDGRSPSAAQADAVRVAEMGAFASIGGPSQTSAYQHELARQRVLCFQCGFAATEEVLATDAPYVWGHLPTPDQIVFGVLGLGSGLFGSGKARFAGDPAMRRQDRKFGVVHYEQDPPVFGPLKKAALARFNRPGVNLGPVIQYLLDPNSLNAQAQAIIGRLKRDGVTTVVFLGDPLMPRLLTQQATKQDYRPEWIFTGTAFTDTTVVARLYDQSQMAHAFGASSSPARTTPQSSEAWRLYRWWYGRAPSEIARTLLFWGPVVQDLFIGIHLAGPDLRAETLAGGLFRYPPTGAAHTAGKDAVGLVAGGYLDGDTSPEVSWGFHQDPDRADYVAVDDFTSVWWNAAVTGPDEEGRRAKGMWEYVGLGLRVSLRDPVTPAGVTEGFMFQTKLSGTDSPLARAVAGTPFADTLIAAPILEGIPKLNALPDYPRRPDSPAERGR